MKDVLGLKCCAHIHGVFPYFLLRTKTDFTPHLKITIVETITTLTGIQANAIHDVTPEKSM